MKKILLVVSFFLLFSQLIVAQVIRDHRKPGTPQKPTVETKPIVDNNVTILTTSGQVTVYENANFSGKSQTFGVGNYRFLGGDDMNDKVSSIKVGPGMAVMIYEHSNEKGGYGSFGDVLEDVPDLSVYNFNDKISFISVINITREGFVWVRARLVNNEYVAGHWERKRANGTLPDNAPPMVLSFLSETFDPTDIAGAPVATEAEINEFNDIQKYQSSVAVLSGETTRPFYYHNNQAGEDVYKYNKIIDPARLPGKFFDWAAGKLGWAGFAVKPFEVATELASDIKDWIFGSSSTKMAIDCWYPDSEFKRTVCGKMEEDVEICTQDYSHTKVTQDKDACYNLMPSEKFVPMLTNRWTGETHGKIEGEVRPLFLMNYNPSTNKSTETTTPKNPLLMQIKKDENVCFYGPWMADILDINLKVPIPFSDESVALGNIDLRKANEIHPVNQLWRKVGNETHLIAIADGTGYFNKTGNNEIAASGLNQRMRFYIAFLLPPKTNELYAGSRTYDVNAVAFDFTQNPELDVSPETLTLKYNGVTRVTVNDNSFVRIQKTHRVFFDKVRKRPNGYVQGYIVIETEPMRKQGGSINIFVKDQTVENSPVGPERPLNRQ